MSENKSGYEKTKDIYSQFSKVSAQLEDVISQMKNEYKDNPETLREVLKAEEDFADVKKNADKEFNNVLKQVKEKDKENETKKEGEDNDN